MDLNKMQRMDKTRYGQLVEVMRRVQTHEMLKLKFLTNFGVSLQSLDYLKSTVFNSEISDLQSRLSQIQETEFILTYMYCQMCSDILCGERIHKRVEGHNNILSGFFERNPDLIPKLKPETNDECVLPEPVILRSKNIIKQIQQREKQEKDSQQS